MNATTKTANVRAWGQLVPAYAERAQDGKVIVRVYDSVAGHYTVAHSLTAAQELRVAARTLPKS